MFQMRTGFIYAPELADLLDRAQGVIRSAASVKPGTGPKEVEGRAERALAHFFHRETRRNPVVRAAAIEV